MAWLGRGLTAAVCGVGLLGLESEAEDKYRAAFFAVYPDAVGTAIETVPSKTNHCGVCHWNFGGGGKRVGNRTGGSELQFDMKLIAVSGWKKLFFELRRLNKTKDWKRHTKEDPKQRSSKNKIQ